MSDQIVMIPSYRVLSKVRILAETVDYNHRLMNVPAMWKKTKGGVAGEELRVVVLDTGIPKHIDLSPSGGKSFISGYSEDKHGHGTHCGGIIAAIANNGMGIAGIAPDVSDYYGAVLDGSGSGTIEQIVKGILWAVDDVGAKIISMSLGIPAGYPNFVELEKACNYAREQGVLVVAAAGNEAGDVGQPACFDSVVSVAAVDRNKKHASFSNTGPEVDFATGGVDVYSTYLNNGYAKLSGTSMACPAFAGLAALIIADEKNDHNKWLTPDETIEKIRKISYDVGADGFDEQFGHGIPVFNSIEEPPPPLPPLPPLLPPEPQPDPPQGKKSSFPCGMTWSLMSAFAEGAGKAAKAGATPDGAILAGFEGVGKLSAKMASAAAANAE